jgi:hypothetical protein
MQPATVMGDPRWWGDYKVSTDFLLKQSDYVELLGRIVVQRGTTVAGYHLRVNSDGHWKLYRKAINKGKNNATLASGKTSFKTGKWHRMGLKMKGDKISVILDGTTVAAVRDSFSVTGQIGLAVSRWNHAQFDNVKITPTGKRPTFIPQKNMTATATSEHSGAYRGYTFTAAKAIDGRPETAWHSEWTPIKMPLPQSITLDLGGGYTVRGLTYRPNFIHLAPKGNITRYNIYISSDGKSFKKVASGNWPTTLATKLVRWPGQKAHYIRLEGVKGVQSMVSAGEINVISQ